MSIKTALVAALTAAVLVPAAPAAANVQVGASGWQWGNPLPQGNTVRAMAFAGTTGYAAGDFGTLLKTNDGGASWSGLPVGTREGLTVVQALDGNTVFAGGGCVARRSTDGGRTFTSVAFTAVESGCRVRLRDLSFTSPDAGYLLLEDGSVFSTTDGGTQFTPRTAVPETSAAGGSAPARAIAFVTATKGFAASGGKIFRTLNGGMSWSAVDADGATTLNRIWFLDADHGFAIGDGGRFVRSDDGGATWHNHAAFPNESLTSISCNTSRFCLLTTAGGNQLIRVADAGNAPPSSITPSNDAIYAAAFASPTRVAAAGANGTTVRSDDAGETFATVGGRLTGRYGAIRAGGAAGTAFAPGADGALAKTTDGGRSWVTGNVPTSADLLDVSFPTAMLGYALDRDGGLFRTDTGGGSWKSLGTGSARRPNAVLAPDDGTVLVVGPRGLRRSVDAGETFDEVRARAVLHAQLTAVAAVRGGAILAWGPSALVRSTDGGASWTALPRPGRSARERRSLGIVQVAFSSAKAGLLCDTAGRVWRTTNAGRAWTLLTSVGTQEVTGISVRSSRTATLVLDKFADHAGGYLLRSDDAGATWQPQFVVDQQIGSGGLAAGAGVDYLLAGNAGLLFSTTGGVAGSPSELTVATKRRRLSTPGRITVTGRLEPAGGRSQVTVSALRPGGNGWVHQTVPVASNGSFVSAWHVPRGTTTFVAQWTGDVASAGTGSKPLTVTVAPGRPKPKHRRAHR